MPTFYWHKGGVGMYYLRDQPFSDPHASIVARSISRGPGRSYLNTVDLERAVLPTGCGTSPKAARAWVEEEICRLLPDAAFVRENFS